MSFGKGCLIACAVIVGVVVLGSVMCVGVVGSAVKQVDNEQKAEVQRAKVASVSDITWVEIETIYSMQSDSTDLQKNEAWKNYKGKKVQWTGTVTSVSDNFGIIAISVKLNPNTFGSDVRVRLEESERSKAVTLTEGDAVTFEGILAKWGTLMDVTIDHGKIVK